jgi:hypothetical protein
MKVYDLYGFLSDDIVAARGALEAALGQQFEARDSDYQGGEYFQLGKAGAEHFVLKRNVDPYDGDPAEQEFPQHPVIFYVNATARAAELRQKIATAGCVLLRHEDLS